jgi:integrase
MSEYKGSSTKLTAAKVAAFAKPEGAADAVLWDTAVPGLGLRAQGLRVQWIWQGRVNGRAVKMTLGRRESMPLESVWSGSGSGRVLVQQGARDEARRLSTLAAAGIDPREERASRAKAQSDRREDAARVEITVADAWDVYLADRSGYWGDAHRSDHAQVMTEPGQPAKRRLAPTAAGVLWSLRDVRLSDLTADRLSAWLAEESARRPAVAARGFRLLRTFVNWCADRPEYRGLVDPSALLTGDVRRKVPKQRPKDDCLQREQLGPWFRSVGGLPAVQGAYLQALLLLGCRPGELYGLTWADVDFQWGSVTIRDKVEGLRTIPLPPHVAGLLGALPRRNDWVFAGAGVDGRMGQANQVMTRVCAQAGVPHVTLHGLRRSFGTLSEWVDVPVGVVAQIQGHKPSAIAERHYRRRPLDLLRQWHERIEAWILREAGIAKPGSSQPGDPAAVTDGAPPASGP